MSVALTATAAPVVIDLTLESSTTLTSPHSTSYTPLLTSCKRALPTQSFEPTSEEPPAKKRRVPEVGPLASHLKTCMQEHLFPHVQRAVDELPRDSYLVDNIAVQALTTLLRGGNVWDGVGLANGLLATDDIADIGGLATQVVKQLTRLPQYQVQKSQPIEEPILPSETQPGPIFQSKQKAIQPVESAQPIRKPDTGPSRVPRPRVYPRSVVPKLDNNSPTSNAWLQLERRPYLHHSARQDIALGVQHPIEIARERVQFPAVYHADFSSLEIAEIVKVVEQHLSRRLPRTRDGLVQILQQQDVSQIVGDAISGRTKQDIYNFCSDLCTGKASQPDNARVLSLEKASPTRRSSNRRANRLPALLLARELEGNVGFGRMRRYENFQNGFQTYHEDGLSLIAEFIDCAGDISAMSWVPDGNVICGTTAHSDAHNQQYNRPGNLMLCSTQKTTLRAFPDHRIPRPVVNKGENSTEAMRLSQDPWLYSSVVSTDYDEKNSRAFTSSFDKTVKVWDVTKDGTSMEAIATWHHLGNVNFVVSAKDGSGRVATATDVPSQAIRIYAVDSNNVQESSYHTISCTRTDADGSDKWAYCPATMQWGRTPGTHHLLAIGYSPRSFTGDDADIPEDKLHSGEIVLWDAERRCQVPVMTATTANVFEIMWHQTLAVFVVATSPSGLNIEHGVRTHIHLFQVDREREDGAYSEFQKLDCYASDINELTIMPNSLRHSYVTAACTDGRVYVWDTAQGDRPIHILKHGDPLEAAISDREKEDTGVKFTAWGTTTDRFYTGSSDGVVKVWNVRRKRSPLVRTLLEAPGAIMCGVFSPDHTKLVVGDATGRVFLFSVDDRDELVSSFTTIPGTNHRVCRPRQYIPHPEPEPPTTSPPESIAQYSRDKYLASESLVLHPNPVVGAVQGPAYSVTGPFRLDAHAYFDPQGPLLPEFERLQLSTWRASLGPATRSMRRLKGPPVQTWAGKSPHDENVAKDFDVCSLDDVFISELVSLGVRFDIEGDEGWEFAYEDMPADTDSC
ncbi:WD domain, G-beta repeat containing protein [Metarhizium rileyi]|uniref:Target of rapamycin complex subunit LST8 n=1 Tax=Metarhizium rileyi (strain RCEF 4871) TaxID=1649241 RepID=A0A166WPT1_METRR|nr:WD domain, G-beta repeat containing protein [Metarhizium rileyi RCEF 4871]